MKRADSASRSLFFEEDGFSTLGMAVALLVTLSLVFSAAQVYRVSSASAGVQDVADAAVLAAENEVAEFMIAVRVCDAVVLTMSLTCAVSYGLGVAALCVPPLSGLGADLVKLGGEVLKARDSFAEKAASGLNRLQEALPFLAAASAASVGDVNSGGAFPSRYCAVAVLVPAKGEAIEVGPSSALSSAKDAIEANAEDLRRASEEAERAAEKANEAKSRAFARDCGDAPAYCMYERARALSGISSAQNPLFHSVEAWSFSVALNRAQTYYAFRLREEAPSSDSIDEQAASALRKVFYRFASNELSKGYVRESDDSFDAYFPALPKNTQEMRKTSLYTEAVFPLGEDGSGGVGLHAWEGCPLAGGGGFGSVAQMESGNYATCPSCKFTAASLGKVAAASSSIPNGFEYHYAAVAEAADEYAEARKTLDEASKAAKSRAGELLESCKNALAEAANARLYANPPGSKGAISLMVNTQAAPASTGFESSFVADAGSLGVRAAVSGATLLEEDGEEGETVITSLLDGFVQGGGGAIGAARVVLDCWSFLLGAYSGGQQALTDAVRRVLGSIPLSSASGLGTWAASKLSGLVADLGFEPANTKALKAVLVNTSLVADADSGAFSARYKAVKNAALSASGPSSSLFSSLVDKAERGALETLSGNDGVIEIVEIELPVGGVRIPLSITLPDYVGKASAGAIGSIADAVRSAVSSVTALKEWR